MSTRLEDMFPPEQVAKLLEQYAKEHPEEVAAAFDRGVKSYLNDHCHPGLRDEIRAAFRRITEPLIEARRDEIVAKVKAKVEMVTAEAITNSSEILVSKVKSAFDYGEGRDFARMLSDRLLKGIMATLTDGVKREP